MRKATSKDVVWVSWIPCLIKKGVAMIFLFDSLSSVMKSNLDQNFKSISLSATGGSWWRLSAWRWRS